VLEGKTAVRFDGTYGLTSPRCEMLPEDPWGSLLSRTTMCGRAKRLCVLCASNDLVRYRLSVQAPHVWDGLNSAILGAVCGGWDKNPKVAPGTLIYDLAKVRQLVVGKTVCSDPDDQADALAQDEDTLHRLVRVVDMGPGTPLFVGTRHE
jgi:hypothetical protein